MPKVKHSSSQHQPAFTCGPTSVHGRGCGSASMHSHGRGSASTGGRGHEESRSLPTLFVDSGPSASLDGSAGEKLPVHMGRLMAVIHAEVEKITYAVTWWCLFIICWCLLLVCWPSIGWWPPVICWTAVYNKTSTHPDELSRSREIWLYVKCCLLCMGVHLRHI